MQGSECVTVCFESWFELLSVYISIKELYCEWSLFCDDIESVYFYAVQLIWFHFLSVVQGPNEKRDCV